jgi:hypothetical protein
MKTIIIIALAIIISLVIIGGGLGTFFSNVGEGTEKIKQNEKLQDVKEQITSKITSEVTKFDDSVEKSKILQVAILHILIFVFHLIQQIWIVDKFHILILR